MIDDPYRVLPHRSVLDCSLFSASSGERIHADFEHVGCGMALSIANIEENWCPHCAVRLNLAAARRAKAARDAIVKPAALSWTEVEV